jgi:hypothetical protein
VADADSPSPAELTRDELTILIGGVWEALYELGDEEFRIRVGGIPADDARALLKRLGEERRRRDHKNPS